MTENGRKKQGLTYGAAVLLCSAVLVKIIGALFKIPLSSKYCLGDLGFGYFSSAYDFFTPFYSLAMAGLPVAVSKTVSEYAAKGRFTDVRGTLKAGNRLFLAVGIAGFLLTAALIYPLTRLTDPTGQTAYSFIAMAPAILFCCMMSSGRGYYEGLNNMLPTAVSEVIEALGKLFLGLGFAFLTVRLTGNYALAAAAAMLGITLGTALAALYLRIYGRVRGDGITAAELADSPVGIPLKQLMRTLAVLSVPVALASLSNNLAALIDAVTVKWRLSELIAADAGSVRGLYAASLAAYDSAGSPLTDAQLPTFLYGLRGKAYTLYNLVPALTAVLGVSAVPLIAEMSARGDRAGLRKNVNAALKLTALISFPAGAGFIAAGGRLMTLLYDTEASAEIGGPMLQIYGFAALFTGLAVVLTGVLQAAGKQGAALFHIALGAVAKIAVNIIAVRVPSLNIKGAAYGTLACYLVITVLHFFTLIRAVGVIPDLKKLLKIMLAAACAGLSARLVLAVGSAGWVTVLAIFAAAAIYFICLILEKIPEEDDFLSFPGGDKIIYFCKKHRIIR